MYMYVRMRPFRGARRKMGRAHAAGRVETQSVIYDTGMSFTYNSPPDSGHYPYVRMASIRYANTCMQSCVWLPDHLCVHILLCNSAYYSCI